MRKSRGFRNNNPLNIRRGASHWVGQCEVQTDKAFVQFTSMAYGYRAAWKVLSSYYRRFHTLEKRPFNVRNIISRWAPPSENDTASYVRKACQRAGLDPDFPVLFWADLRKLIKAMSWIESRFQPADELLEEARALSLGSAACHQPHSC